MRRVETVQALMCAGPRPGLTATMLCCFPVEDTRHLSRGRQEPSDGGALRSLPPLPVVHVERSSRGVSQGRWHLRWALMKT